MTKEDAHKLLMPIPVSLHEINIRGGYLSYNFPTDKEPLYSSKNQLNNRNGSWDIQQKTEMKSNLK